MKFQNELNDNQIYGQIQDTLLQNTISFRKEEEVTEKRGKRVSTSLQNNRNSVKQDNKRNHKSPMSDSYVKIDDSHDRELEK